MVDSYSDTDGHISRSSDYHNSSLHSSNEPEIDQSSIYCLLSRCTDILLYWHSRYYLPHHDRHGPHVDAALRRHATQLVLRNRRHCWLFNGSQLHVPLCVHVHELL